MRSFQKFPDPLPGLELGIAAGTLEDVSVPELNLLLECFLIYKIQDSFRAQMHFCLHR